MNKQCLFHVDRPEFERMERDIKRAKLIPREYCHRLASAVCACRKHPEWHADEAQLSEHVQNLQNMLQTNTQKLSKFLVEVLKTVLETVNPSDYSRCRLLQILFLAQYGNFVLLTRSAIRENAVACFDTEVLKEYQEYREKEKLKDRALQMTSKMFKFSNPEMRHISSSEDDHCDHSSYTDAHEFDLNDSHSKKGNLICALNRFTTKRNFDNNVNRSHIDIRRSNPGAVRALRSVLKQQEREKHLNQCETMHRNKPSKIDRGDNSDKETTDISPNSKDRLTDDFEIKAHRNESQVINRKLAKKSSVLDGGHCRQCLQPFTSLSPSSGCKHHPGFVSYGGNWTCCYNYVGWRYNVNDLKTSHAQHGCVEGVHSWRMDKKLARKPSRYLLERNPTLRIHLKEYLRTK